MKILYYNWVPFDDDENRGGGVSVYQRNLISYLLKQSDNEVYFISSGIAYTAESKGVYIKRTSNIYGKRCKTYQIINSPILSPGHCAFDDMDIYLSDLELYQIFKKFITQNGPFDVIHFNNFEGLSLHVLKIKEDFPNTKMIYSLHNYYAFCPQVNLWKKERESCYDFHDGKDCLTCLTYKADKQEVLFANKLAYKLKICHFNSHTAVYRLAFRYAYYLRKWSQYINKYIRKIEEPRKCFKICSSHYKLYREKNIEFLNTYIDTILCVSERVREIAIKMGIMPEKAITDYIGTVVAENQASYECTPIDTPIFTILFMGYMRKDKGFFFLLKALKEVSPEISINIRVVIAAKISDQRLIEQFRKLGKHYYEIDIYDGYSHKELDKLFNGVNLGIIPVLWEDNLPQVAIEMVSRGVPILTSDKGGAHELCNDPLFIFESNNKAEFVEKLEHLYLNRSDLKCFWHKKMPLTTFKEHIEKLKLFYRYN